MVNVNDSIATPRLEKLPITSMGPLFGMTHDTCTHHVEVDIDKAARQMLAILHHGRVIAIFPECTLTPLPSIVLLCRSSRDELHAFRDLPESVVSHQEMNVIALAAALGG